MKSRAKVLLPVLLLLALGCADPEEVDTGGVVLQVELADSVFRIGVNDQDTVAIPSIEITSIVPNASAGTSNLMNVQLDLYEVTYARADGGTRLPPPMVFKLSSVVPVGGQLTLSNFPVMTVDQMRVPPLSDLLFTNGGFDKETGATTIRIDITIVFFGRTLAGDEVSSVPRTQTLEFVPTLSAF